MSCDPFNPLNPLPIYDDVTTLAQPTRRLVQDAETPLDIVAIDHLPSLVPGASLASLRLSSPVLSRLSPCLSLEESSREFASALLPHLLEFGASPVWQRAEKLFVEKSAALLGPK